MKRREDQPISRRDFLRIAALSTAGLGLSACGLSKPVAILTPEQASTPSKEGLARQLSEKYGLEIKTPDSNVENYGLPFSAEEILEKIKSGNIWLSFYSLGSRIEKLTQFHQLQKDDFLHPGKKENLIVVFSKVYNAQRDMPRWVLDLLNTNNIMVATAVDEVVDNRFNRNFLGVREGLLLLIPQCDYTLGCREKETSEFIQEELGLITYYTQDKRGLLPSSR